MNSLLQQESNNCNPDNVDQMGVSQDTVVSPKRPSASMDVSKSSVMMDEDMINVSCDEGSLRSPLELTKLKDSLNEVDGCKDAPKVCH